MNWFTNFFNPKSIPCKCGSVDLHFFYHYNNKKKKPGYGISCNVCGNEAKVYGDMKFAIKFWNWRNQPIKKTDGT